MKSETIHFPLNGRRVFTAVKNAVINCPRFKQVKIDETAFSITATHGVSILPLGENIKIRVISDSTHSCNVISESSSRLFFNIFGSNSENISTLDQFIKNSVWKLLRIEQSYDSEKIRIVKPDIKFQKR